MTNEADRNVSPKVRELTIGIRNSRKISLYPLSIKSIEQVSDVFQAVYDDMLEKLDDYHRKSNEAIALDVVSFVRNNPDEDADVLTKKVGYLLGKSMTRHKEKFDMELGSKILSAAKQNFGKIIGFASGEDGDVILEETDSEQFIEAFDSVIDQNFNGDVLKKAMGLFGKVKQVLTNTSDSERPQPSSVKSTDTPSTTSSRNTLKTEE